jgi:Tfp pilus assembly protein PilF
MFALVAAKPDITEDLELGRALLGQGHLDTAQRVLVKACQNQPECAAAFRALAEVLNKRGDGGRAGPLVAYADELDPGNASEPIITVDDVPSDADTHQHHLRMVKTPASAPPPIPRLTLPSVPVPVAATATVSGRGGMSAESVAAMMAATEPSPPPRSPFPVRPPSSQALSQRPNRRRDLAVLAVVACAVAAVAAVAAFSQQGRSKPLRVSPRDELDRALASGTLETLMRARDVARMALAAGTADADALVRLGLVNAFLAEDYGLDAGKDTEEALQRSEAIPDVGGKHSDERTALAATARAMLALASRDRVRAKLQAEVAVAAVSPDPPALALLASARVARLAGDAAGAASALDRALVLAPDVAPVAADWAASRLDGGDPVAARRVLAASLDKYKDNARVRLLFADAERAVGETEWVKNLDLACRSDAKISRTIRASCAVGSALQARLDGERAAAVRKVKAASQTSDDPWLLGQASLLLALLGEVDVAEEALNNARKSADASAIPLAWAALAIALGRGESVPAVPFAERPAGPERDLVALRLAYRQGKEQGKPSAMAAVLKSLPPGIQDIDWDVRAFAVLARDSGPSKPELLALEKRADKGNPVVSYVLGVLATRDNDFKLAARKLERALGLHGDACQAAKLYLTAVERVGRHAQPNKNSLRLLHGHNAKCALPEM